MNNFIPSMRPGKTSSGPYYGQEFNAQNNRGHQETSLENMRYIDDEYVANCLHYFQSNGIIFNNSADREVVRSYYNTYIKTLRYSVSFYVFLGNLNKRGIIKRKHGHGLETINFNETKLNKILNDMRNLPSIPKKTVIVSQRVSFEHKHSKPALITPTKCDICKESFVDQQAYNEHTKEKKHQLSLLFVQDRKRLSTNKDIVVEHENGFGNMPEMITVKPNSEEIFSLFIKNTSEGDYQVMDLVELNKTSEITILKKDEFPMILKRAESLVLDVSACFPNSLTHDFIIVLEVKNLANGEVSNVLKLFYVYVHSMEFNDLHSVVAYKKPKGTIVEIDDEVVPGVPVEIKSDYKPAIPLKLYKIPTAIRLLLNTGLKGISSNTPELKNELKRILSLLDVENPKNCLNVKNYYEMLRMLLYAEEHQMSKNIRDYDQETQDIVQVKGRGNFFELNVPGLAENRPSILRGDAINVKEPNSKTVYQGIVHNIQETKVVLGFNKRFSESVHQNKKLLQVSFTYNRLTLRTEHQALDFINKHKAIPLLFPENHGNKELTKEKLIWFNKNIENNSEQQQAVRHILSKTAYPAPYLIFGPPGTGKTSTVVEAIKQIWKKKNNNKILVCAPSNNAANLIAELLIQQVPKTDLLRYVSFSFPPNNIKLELKPYCNYNRFGDFYHPKIEDILKYEIVVTTITTASRLVNAGTPLNHFSYVFIDESGNATETETLIPIAGLLTSATQTGEFSGQIVLAGDPKQLGPIIHSPLAKQYGFDVSMLARLMDTLNLYKKNASGKYNDAVLVKLLNNYRSHSEILKVPNKLFYDDELIAKGEYTTLAIGWHHLPNPKVPIIFHNVIGRDEREKTSPSWFNVQEIEVIIGYLKNLFEDKFCGTKMNQSDIGILTPYRQQVHKIKQACQKYKWNDIYVGSVEQFQGQERRVIIISTVRSQTEFMQFDHKFHLGFLSNPKRFNVAVTRAKSLLIIVGNAVLMQCDPTWYAMIKFCKENGLTKGIPFALKENPDPVEEITIDIKKLTVKVAQKDDSTDFSRGNL